MKQAPLGFGLAGFIVLGWLWVSANDFSKRSAKHLQSTQLLTDTVPKKKYVVVFDVNDVYGKGNKLDSSTLILQYIGKTQTVDQADAVKKFYIEVIGRFLALGRLDSVWVKSDSTINKHKNK